MKNVFLGGTCSNSTWRNKLIKLLKIDYFDPVVDDWTPECLEEEIKQRKICDYVLYVITPFMKGVYSIAEVVDDSNKRPEKTLFCVLENDRDDISWTRFSKEELKSLEAVEKMLKNNGVKIFNNLEEIAAFLNRSSNE